MEIISSDILNFQPVDDKMNYPFTEALMQYKMTPSEFRIINNGYLIKASNHEISCTFKYKDKKLSVIKDDIWYIIKHGMVAFRKDHIDDVIKMICDMGFTQEDDHYIKDKVSFQIVDREYEIYYCIQIKGHDKYIFSKLDKLKSTINNLLMICQRMDESNISIKRMFPNAKFYDISYDHQIDCEITYKKNYHEYSVSFFKHFHEDWVKVTFNQSLDDNYYYYSITEAKTGSFNEMIQLVKDNVKKFSEL